MVRKLPLLALALGVTSIFSSVSFGQLPNVGVIKYSQITLSGFGAGAGNDCWGYVSPSGREYALVGLNNRVSFVEVTNPSAPVLLGNIPHTASTWGDIKVYGHYAYAVTEAAGTGIQVFDLSNIDTGQVLLVNNILSPGRTHNLALNPVSGFLYTCGSRDGTGTTMCFSLANPAAPVQVGAASMTTNYMHDGNVVSYTSGPLAGREIWYGFSEGRGVDIYDFTDKNNPFLIKRVTYPSMGYCHQGWLSEDRKYLYVDDELDEQNAGGNLNTRSLIFNVEDPANAFFVGTFTSGLPSIDHNQYTSDGFTFQANYQSGLRIFDLSQNPAVPIQVGAYDTYTSSNGAAFNGAWSTYPYFPSGTVIVSDINSGLFVLNATEATTRAVNAESFAPGAYCAAKGSLSDITASDNTYLLLNTMPNDVFVASPLQIDFSTTAYDTSPTKIRLVIESIYKDGSVRGGVSAQQAIELYDWTTNTFVSVNQTPIGSTEQSIEVTAPGNVQRFVNQSTREVKARVRWQGSKMKTADGKVLIDQFLFRITR